MNKKGLVIFDMDGVLVDVTGSYREVIRLSVVNYLRFILGVKKFADSFISLTEIDKIKKSGGLNNDWDLTYAILNSILIIYFDKFNEDLKKEQVKLKELRNDGKIWERVLTLRNRYKTDALEANLGKMPVSQIFLSSQWGNDLSPFLLNQGDVKTGNLVKRIFQETYLGKELFKRSYGESPLYYQGEGYIEREVLIPGLSDLEKLASLYTLSIATGRPEWEAEYTLNRFGISGMFAALVTEDDIEESEANSKTSLRKPHPFILNLCRSRSGADKAGKVFYVGDMPDDIVASKRAGFIPIGFVNEGSFMDDIGDHKALLLQKGAFRVFGNFLEIVNFFSNIEFNS